MNVTLYAYRYENFVVRLHFPSGSKRPVDAAAISDELAHYFGLRAIFSPASDLLDTKNLLLSPAARVNFGVQFQIPGLILQGLPVAVLETTGTGYLEKIELQIPMTSVYKPSVHRGTPRQLFVQQFNLGETQAIHKNDVLAITLDLSALSLPPYWQFRYCQVSGSKVYDMDSFEILHPERIPMKIDRIHIEICEEPSE